MNRRFQFSLANLLALMLAVAIACAIAPYALAIASLMPLLSLIPLTFWCVFLAVATYAPAVAFSYWLFYWRKRPWLERKQR